MHERDKRAREGGPLTGNRCFGTQRRRHDPRPGRRRRRVLARSGNEFFAVGAQCTHYRGPLAEGIVVGDTVRCPWHHACFSLRTGEALRAPALDPIACWRVERQGDTDLRAARSCRPAPASRRRRPRASRPRRSSSSAAAPPGWRRPTCCGAKGYDGPVTMISADADRPVDRPNLSKDYLAGNAQEDWIPLRSPRVLRRAADRR